MRGRSVESHFAHSFSLLIDYFFSLLQFGNRIRGRQKPQSWKLEGFHFRGSHVCYSYCSVIYAAVLLSLLLFAGNESQDRFIGSYIWEGNTKTRHTYRYFQLSEKKPSKVNSKPKTRLLRHLKIRRIDVMLLLQSLASFYSRIKSYTSMSWKVKKETT